MGAVADLIAPERRLASYLLAVDAVHQDTGHPKRCLVLLIIRMVVYVTQS